ncbi:hypothetical protein DSECCO2_524660 [anaerobic digester metagenome]
MGFFLPKDEEKLIRQSNFYNQTNLRIISFDNKPPLFDNREFLHLRIKPTLDNH